MNSNTLDFENLVKENKNQKYENQLLEREINILKSLILINNLNLSSIDIDYYESKSGINPLIN